MARGSRSGGRSALAWLLVATAINSLGSKVSLLAVPWLVLVTTGSPVKMGLVGLAQTLPYVIVGIVGSPVVDRFGVRRLAILNDTTSAILTGLIAVYAQHDFRVLLVLACLIGSVQGVGDKAKRMLLQPVVQAAGASMPRMVAVVSGRERVTTVVGAAVGGLMIAWLGAPGAIWVNAASFALGALLVGVFVPVAEESKPDDREPYVDSLRRGFTFLREERLLRGIVGVMFLTNLFNQASGMVLVPLWVMEHFRSPVALGWVASALALGAVLGNTLFIGLVKRLPRYQTFVLGYLLGGAPRFLVLGLSDDLRVVLGVTFVSGIATSVINPVYGALLFERVPRHMQARVFGLTGALTFGGVTVGGLVAAWFVQSYGLQGALILCGIGYLAASLSPLFGYRLWKRMDGQATAVGLPPWFDSFALAAHRALPVHAVQPPLVLKLSYMDKRWRVSGRYGYRRAFGPSMVTSAKAVETIKLLGVPELYETVEQLHRAEVAALRARALELRRELERLERYFGA